MRAAPSLPVALPGRLVGGPGRLAGSARFAPVLCAVATLVGVAAAVDALRSRAQAAELRQRLWQATKQSGAVDAEPRARADFVAQLPAATDGAGEALRWLERACRESGVRLLSSVFASPTGDAHELQQRAWSVELQGSYAGVKRALGSLLEHTPQATLRTLQLQRVPDSNDLSARLGLVLWARPRSSAPEGR